MVVLTLKNCSCTHRFEYRWIYLPLEERFADGFCHRGTLWACEFEISVPTEIVIWEIMGNRRSGMYLRLYRKELDGEGKVIKSEMIAEGYFYNDIIDQVLESQETPQSVKDMINAEPFYHQTPKSPKGLTYQRGELERAIAFINKYKRVRLI